MSESASNKTIHHKVDAKLSIKSVDDATGEFEGYASTYSIDQSDERIAKGAWARTLSHSGGKVPILFGHSTMEPCGWNKSAEETNEGLLVHGKINLETEVGRKAYYHLKGAQEVGARGGLSVGFRSLKSHWEEDKATKKQIRIFDECQLLEYSVVVFPCQLEAQVTQIKSSYDAANSTTEPLPEEAKQSQTSQPSGENPNENKPGETVMSIDFNAALSERQRQRELAKSRSDIEGALYDTLSAVHGADMDADSKKSLIHETYQKHASAMGDWHIQSYFTGGQKSFTVDFLRKEDESAREATARTKAAPAEIAVDTLSAEQLVEIVKSGKGKMSAAMKATMKHALDLHQSAIDLHGKAMTICKDAFADDSSPEVPGSSMGTEMGALSDKTPVEAKEEKPVAGATPVTETKGAESAPSERTPSQQEPDSDSGIHSLAEELLNLIQSRKESL